MRDRYYVTIEELELFYKVGGCLERAKRQLKTKLVNYLKRKNKAEKDGVELSAGVMESGRKISREYRIKKAQVDRFDLLLQNIKTPICPHVRYYKIEGNF